MHPSDLRAENFSKYPPQAKQLAVAHLAVLQRIPLALLPLILRQLINYDWLFPPEQRELQRQMDYLGSLSAAQFTAFTNDFAPFQLPRELGNSDWVNQPKHFSEQLTAYLWSVHQIDAYHGAVRAYLQKLDGVHENDTPRTSRCTIVVVGAGVKETNLALFRRLRPYGTLFTAVDPHSGLQALRDAVAMRARQYPGDYAHWYIDGNDPDENLRSSPGVTTVSYAQLAPAIRKELSLLSHPAIQPSQVDTSAVETVTAYMEDMQPKDLGLGSVAGDPAVQHFQLDVLTEGSGTQVYSTTFVQWAARECLHRAQPLTLLARFRPRQQAAPMNELIARDPFAQAVDPAGSLLDADMGAYLTWINQSRLPGADRSRFLAWFEDHSIAIAVGPSMAQRAASDTPTDLNKILAWMA
jgi:hypothetical protein